MFRKKSCRQFGGSRLYYVVYEVLCSDNDFYRFLDDYSSDIRSIYISEDSDCGCKRIQGDYSFGQFLEIADSHQSVDIDHISIYFYDGQAMFYYPYDNLLSCETRNPNFDLEEYFAKKQKTIIPVTTQQTDRKEAATENKTEHSVGKKEKSAPSKNVHSMGNYQWDKTDGVLTFAGKGPIENFMEHIEQNHYTGDWDAYTIAPWGGNPDDTTWMLDIKEGITGIGDNAFGSTELTWKVGEKVLGRSNQFTALRKVNLPEGLISIGNYAFEDCCSLTEMVIPDTVEYIGREAFRNTPFEKALSKKAEQVPVILGKVLWKYSGPEEEFHVPGNVTQVAEDAFKDCPNLKRVIAADRIIIQRGAYRNNSEIEEIELPYGVTEIQSQAFRNCCKLKKVVLPDSVSVIGQWAFSGCRSLESVILPDSISEIDQWTFEDCTALASVSFPHGLKKICAGAFHNCKSLKKVVLPDSVSVIEREAFEGCTALASVRFPHGLKEIQDAAFRNCQSLKEVILEADTTIGNSAFKNCVSLEKVQLSRPCGLAEYAFSGCSSLREIRIESASPFSFLAFRTLSEKRMDVGWTSPAVSDCFSEQKCNQFDWLIGMEYAGRTGINGTVRCYYERPKEDYGSRVRERDMNSTLHLVGKGIVTKKDMIYETQEEYMDVGEYTATHQRFPAGTIVVHPGVELLMDAFDFHATFGCGIPDIVWEHTY